MLDIQFIRDNKDVLRFSLERRGATVDLDALEKVDDERKNAAQDRSALEEILPRWRALMLTVPNVLDISVPAGKPDEQMFELRTVEGGKNSRDIVTLHTHYDIARVVRSEKFTTRRYAGKGLELYDFLKDVVKRTFHTPHTQEGMAPFCVSKDTLVAAHVYSDQLEADVTSFGYIPHDAYLYALERVSATTYEQIDIPHTALVHGLTIDAHTDTHEIAESFGVVRVCEPTHQASIEAHEALTKEMEEFLTRLGITYKVYVRTALYTPAYAVKSYHIAVRCDNTFVPFCDIAYMHDFLSRRIGTKMKAVEGKTRFAHLACITHIPLHILSDAFITSHEDPFTEYKRLSTEA